MTEENRCEELVRTAATVRFWLGEEGWGVIDTPLTPGGCWTHFSAVRMSGYRTLVPGATAVADVRPGNQDGYAWVAEAVWPEGVTPDTDPAPAPASDAAGAYRSRLVLTADDGTVLFDSATDNIAQAPWKQDSAGP